MFGPRVVAGCAWRLVDLYGLVMAIYVVLWQSTGDRFVLVYLTGFVAHLALPVAFIWLPVSLLRRRWGSLLIQGVCLGAFVWLFGDVLVDRDPAPPPAGATAVTVMTYNLGSDLATPDRLIRLLRASDADIVGLQELQPEMATALAAGLADAYPYQDLHASDDAHGKGLLSRFPILRGELLPLNPDRPDLRAVLAVGDVEVTVIVTHPSPPQLTWTSLARRPGAADHLAALLATIEATGGPLLLLGDLNMTRMHTLYDQLESAGLRDVYRVAGDGMGFTVPARIQALADLDLPFGDPAVFPLVRIDYIWASQHWLPVDARVVDGAGSDHLPVVARVALAPATG